MTKTRACLLLSIVVHACFLGWWRTLAKRHLPQPRTALPHGEVWVTADAPADKPYPSLTPPRPSPRRRAKATPQRRQTSSTGHPERLTALAPARSARPAAQAVAPIDLYAGVGASLRPTDPNNAPDPTPAGALLAQQRLDAWRDTWRAMTQAHVGMPPDLTRLGASFETRFLPDAASLHGAAPAPRALSRTFDPSGAGTRQAENRRDASRLRMQRELQNRLQLCVGSCDGGDHVTATLAATIAIDHDADGRPHTSTLRTSSGAATFDAHALAAVRDVLQSATGTAVLEITTVRQSVWEFYRPNLALGRRGVTP